MEQAERAKLEDSCLIQHTSALPSVRDRTPQPSSNHSPTLDLGLGLIPGTVSFEIFISNKGSALLLWTISTQVSDVCRSSDQKKMVLKGEVIIIFTGDCTGIYAQR